jgi:hypothetical protein
MNDPQHGIQHHKRKLLAFTDNRQDAALQAGHFNDFLFVSLLRAGILAAARAAGPDGLGQDDFGIKVRQKLGFIAANKNRRKESMNSLTILSCFKMRPQYLETYRHKSAEKPFAASLITCVGDSQQPPNRCNKQSPNKYHRHLSSISVSLGACLSAKISGARLRLFSDPCRLDRGTTYSS